MTDNLLIEKKKREKTNAFNNTNFSILYVHANSYGPEFNFASHFFWMKFNILNVKDKNKPSSWRYVFNKNMIATDLAALMGEVLYWSSSFKINIWLFFSVEHTKKEEDSFCKYRNVCMHRCFHLLCSQFALKQHFKVVSKFHYFFWFKSWFYERYYKNG